MPSKKTVKNSKRKQNKSNIEQIDKEFNQNTICYDLKVANAIVEGEISL